MGVARFKLQSSETTAVSSEAPGRRRRRCGAVYIKNCLGCIRLEPHVEGEQGESTASCAYLPSLPVSTWLISVVPQLGQLTVCVNAIAKHPGGYGFCAPAFGMARYVPLLRAAKRINESVKSPKSKSFFIASSLRAGKRLARNSPYLSMGISLRGSDWSLRTHEP